MNTFDELSDEELLSANYTCINTEMERNYCAFLMLGRLNARIKEYAPIICSVAVCNEIMKVLNKDVVQER